MLKLIGVKNIKGLIALGVMYGVAVATAWLLISGIIIILS